MTMTMTVRAHELATLLDRAPEGITTLSLDCFDTLLWRNLHAPSDVFAGIPFAGGGVEPRTWAEGATRRKAFARTKSYEIGLTDIYRRMLTRADDASVAAGVEHELALEASHCFPFAPAVELMNAAKARGLRIIIVSDMYLDEPQLRELLRRSAGDDVLDMVDRIFMSSDHGTSKAHGLFNIVLDAIGAQADQVLHVGDNHSADYLGAAKTGIHAVHLQQFDDEVVQRLRLEAACGVMLDPATRVTVPTYQPHRAQLALRRQDDTAYTVGHDVMGPVMHAFADYLKADLDAMAQRLGKPVRPLFLMRDGYLPYAVFDALYPEYGGKPIEISRLTAARASLGTPADVTEFLDEYTDILPGSALAKQVMLHGHEIGSLIKDPGGKREDDRKFRSAVRKPDMIAKIVKRSRAFTQRMVAHLDAAGVRRGDAVMLVDVGYKGTVQNIVTPVLERELGLTIAGRYLFLREECASGLDKAGLLGTDMFECRALHALGTCVAVVEQMCNIAQGSTIDYTPDGAPIREASGVKSLQNATRDRIQAACVDFARTAFDGMHRRPSSDTIESRRRMAGSILTRLLFLPLPSEIALFERFDHDVNLGTSVMIPLLDHDEASEGLRRRGIAYVGETRRMYVPGEIARHGMALTLSLLTTSRFGLDVRNVDFEVGGIDVPVLMLTATEQTVLPMKAYPTHEGFYRVTVPVGMQRPTLAIQLGAMAELVQIERAIWTPIKAFDASFTAPTTDAITVTDGMTAIADDIYSSSEAGVVIAAPPSGTVAGPQVLTLVFRPLKLRGSATAQKIAA